MATDGHARPRGCIPGYWLPTVRFAVKSRPPGCRRPVVVVQSEAFNRSRIQTVVAITLTSNLRLAAAPGNVLLPAKAAGLPRDSVANVSLDGADRRRPTIGARALAAPAPGSSPPPPLTS